MGDATAAIRLGPRRRRRVRTVWLYFLTLLAEFRWTLVALGLALLVGTLLYRVTPHKEFNGQRPPLGWSIYFAWLALLSQNVLSLPATWYLAVLTAVYPVLGLTLVGQGVVRLALLMVSRKQGEKEWMTVMAATYRDHVVLCGLGHLGFRVLEQLVAGGTDVVVVERDANGKFVTAAKEMGVPVLIRDMKDDSGLIDAGIPHARAVIVATNNDMANIEVALDSRRMNPKIRVIMRLFDQQIAEKVAGAFLVDVAFSSSTLAAPAVAAMCLQTPVLSNFNVAGVPHAVFEIKVQPGSSLSGWRLGEVEGHHGVKIISRLPAEGGNGSTEKPIAPGDTLIVTGPSARGPALAQAARQSS